MKNLPSIFLSGESGSGKDSIADALINSFPNITYRKHNLAWSLYNFWEKYEKDLFKKYTPPDKRVFLQTLGTNIARNSYHHDIWIDRFLDDIGVMTIYDKECLLLTTKWICTDVRFDNEVYSLLSKGWVGYYIECPEKVRKHRISNRDNIINPDYLEHESETEFDKFKDKLHILDGTSDIDVNVNIIKRKLEMFDNNLNK